MESFRVNFDALAANSWDLKDVLPLFKWYTEPRNCSIKNKRGLCVVPKPRSDFWCRTYQNPPMDVCSGHALLSKVSNTSHHHSFVVEVMFSVSPVHQYDHAGLMIFIDEKHWLKAGYELDDGSHQMSCVVTNGASDWNCLDWGLSSNIRIRLSVQQYEFFCECKAEYNQDGSDWRFLREGPIILPNSDSVISFGPMGVVVHKVLRE